MGWLKIRSELECLCAGTDAAAGDRVNADRLLLRLAAAPGRISRLLAAVARDPASCYAIGTRSYRHPLGFDKIVLMDLGHGAAQLRLHLWWPGESRVREDVHSHRFDLASLVVVGELQQETFRLDPDGIDYTCYRECSPVGSTEWRFIRVDEVTVRRQSAFSIPAGQNYWLDADVLHRAAALPRAFTATLFVQAPAGRDYSLVVVPRSDRLDRPRTRQRFSAEDIRRRLLHTVAGIAAADADGRIDLIGSKRPAAAVRRSHRPVATVPTP